MSTDNETRVVVVDIRMRFWSMVIFMVKLAIASIPAVLILSILWAVVAAVFGSVFIGAGGRSHF